MGDYIYLNGQPLALIRKQENLDRTYYYHNDHLGTPKVMTDKLQQIVWNIDFDPFGNDISINGREGEYIRNVTNNLRFPGQYFDEETGLHYNYFRDYDPKVGRHITSDPIGLRGGLNTYLYAKANPLRFIDPKGLYGTQSCSYYDQACTANQGTYECKVAPELCPRFPDNDDPTGNSDKIGNWSECVRQSCRRSTRIGCRTRNNAAQTTISASETIRTITWIVGLVALKIQKIHMIRPGRIFQTASQVCISNESDKE